MIRTSLFCCLLLVCALTPATSQSRFALKPGQRILFMGDSITNAGHYVQYVELYLRTRFPESTFSLFNLGLGSETVTGLTEPDHPFPRPDAHERLERALTQVKPHIVVVCYGMNDGIYHPFSAERFAKYQAGIQKAVAVIRKAKATPILMTPPPFDPTPIRGIVRPLNAPEFGYKFPYEDYDSVLAQYAAWLITLRNRQQIVVDTRSTVLEYLKTARAAKPDYSISGDGVHINEVGHALIARALLTALSAPAKADELELDYKTRRLRKGKATGISLTPEEIRFDWETTIPYPQDSRWDDSFMKFGGWDKSLSQWTLTIKNLPHPSYRLLLGEVTLATLTREELASGVPMQRFQQLLPLVQAKRALELVKQRERILSSAWLTHVGHKRPQTPAGLPIGDALSKAEPLDQEIKRLCEPVTLSLRLLP